MGLLAKIKNKQALVGIIGLGYVGLPLVLRFTEVGFKVLGFDTDERKVERVNRGESYIKYIPSSRLAELVQTSDGRQFAATSDMGRLGEPDVLIICVSTPLTRRQPSCWPNSIFFRKRWDSDSKWRNATPSCWPPAPGSASPLYLKDT